LRLVRRGGDVVRVTVDAEHVVGSDVLPLLAIGRIVDRLVDTVPLEELRQCWKPACVILRWLSHVAHG